MITELLNLNLLKELGLDSLSQEKREALISRISGVVESRISLQISSLLPEADKKELDKVLDSDGDLVAFLRSKIANFDIMVAEIIANVKKELLDMRDMAFTK